MLELDRTHGQPQLRGRLPAISRPCYGVVAPSLVGSAAQESVHLGLDGLREREPAGETPTSSNTVATSASEANGASTFIVDALARHTCGARV